MSFEFKNISPDTLGHPSLDLLTSFHHYYRRNNGVLDDDLTKFFPFLTLCSATDDLIVSPPILSVGSKSDQKRFYGETWADNILAEQATPDSKLEILAAEGYRMADEEGISCQDCFSMIDIGGGVQKPCFYVRHISKIRTPKGTEFFALTAKILNLELQ